MTHLETDSKIPQKYPEVGIEIVVVSPKWKQKQEFK